MEAESSLDGQQQLQDENENQVNKDEDTEERKESEQDVENENQVNKVEDTEERKESEQDISEDGENGGEEDVEKNAAADQEADIEINNKIISDVHEEVTLGNDADGEKEMISEPEKETDIVKNLDEEEEEKMPDAVKELDSERNIDDDSEKALGTDEETSLEKDPNVNIMKDDISCTKDICLDNIEEDNVSDMRREVHLDDGTQDHEENVPSNEAKENGMDENKRALKDSENGLESGRSYLDKNQVTDLDDDVEKGTVSDIPGKTDSEESPSLKHEKQAEKLMDSASKVSQSGDLNTKSAMKAKPKMGSIKNSISKFDSGSKKEKGMIFAAQPDKCSACEKTVYAMEKLEMNKNIYHKGCFKCSHCSATLTAKTFSINEGVIFCTTHFKQLFARKGNYDEGFGRQQYKKKWTGDPAKKSEATA